MLLKQSTKGNEGNSCDAGSCTTWACLAAPATLPPARLLMVENSCGLRRKCRLFAYDFSAARAFALA
jgi:hypothetical protein